jgi:hypothetical protein
VRSLARRTSRQAVPLQASICENPPLQERPLNQ